MNISRDKNAFGRTVRIWTDYKTRAASPRTLEAEPDQDDNVLRTNRSEIASGSRPNKSWSGLRPKKIPPIGAVAPRDSFDQLADEVENCGALRGSLPSWDPGLMAVFLIGTALIGMELTTVRPFHVACLIEGLFN